MSTKEKSAATLYADSKMKYFLEHWNDQTKAIVRLMIFEAYIAGYKAERITHAKKYGRPIDVFEAEHVE